MVHNCCPGGGGDDSELELCRTHCVLLLGVVEQPEVNAVTVGLSCSPDSGKNGGCVLLLMGDTTFCWGLLD